MERQRITPGREGVATRKRVVSPKIIAIAVALLIVVGIAGFIVYQQDRAAKLEAARLEDAYQKAISVKESGDYETAVSLFLELGDYSDSPNMIQACYDAQSLESLRVMYQGIDTVYQVDNKLADMVSTVISNVDKINSADTKLQIRANTAISCLYDGDSCRAYARCSLYDLASIKAYFPSVQVSEGTVFYEAYIPLFSQEKSQNFLDSIQSATSSLGTIENLITDTENLPDMYQEIHKQLRLAYDALKDYHSFVENEPTDYENYNTTATSKKTAVSDLLKNLPSTITTNK